LVRLRRPPAVRCPLCPKSNRVAAGVVGAIDEHAANALRAELAERDFLRTLAHVALRSGCTCRGHSTQTKKTAGATGGLVWLVYGALGQSGLPEGRQRLMLALHWPLDAGRWTLVWGDPGRCGRCALWALDNAANVSLGFIPRS
jgi:hypothetical protein